MKYGLRTSPNKSVQNLPLSDLGGSSEANQWKVHLIKLITFTAYPQTITFRHGLTYTPAFMSFQRTEFPTPAYYQDLNASDYADDDNIAVVNNNGTATAYKIIVVFKDFGR